MIFLASLSGHLCEALNLRHRKCHYCCFRLPLPLSLSLFYPHFNQSRLNCHTNGLSPDVQGRAKLWLLAMLLWCNPSITGWRLLPVPLLLPWRPYGPCQLLCAALALCLGVQPDFPFLITQYEGLLSDYHRWPWRKVRLSTNKVQIMQIL